MADNPKRKVSIALDDDLIEALDQKAAARRGTRSGVARELLADALMAGRMAQPDWSAA